MSPGEILFLENIRFVKDEENDSEEFARRLAKLGDIFINEAFSCSHRKQASLHKITKFIDSYGGPLLKKKDPVNKFNFYQIRRNLCHVLLADQKFQQRLT